MGEFGFEEIGRIEPAEPSGRPQLQAQRFVEKARTLANKRNDLLHHLWVMDKNRNPELLRMPFVEKLPSRPVPLKEIQDTIISSGLLLAEIFRFPATLAGDPTYTPSPDKQPLLIEDDKPV